MSYGPADKILKGADASRLPIEQASRTARRMGLTMPQSLLVRADRVID